MRTFAIRVIALAVLVITPFPGSSRNAHADTEYGRQCTRVLPTQAFTVFHGKALSTSTAASAARYGSCLASSALVEDEHGAGLDYAAGAELDEIDGAKVSGCLRVDFPLRQGSMVLAGLTITAKPSPSACSRANTPCGSGYCGTGGDFSVFTARYSHRLHLVATVHVATPNWSEYRLTLPRDAQVVVVCRTGNGPARDDVLIDAVKGCAVDIGDD